jgi:O-antigen/teichoic acid export membrane protein
MIAFVLWLPSTVAGRIQTGLQMGGLANLCQAISSVAMGLLTYGAVTRGASLHTLVIIACFTPVAGHLVNTALLFLLRPQVRPSPRLIRWHASQDLLRLGVLFFTLQLGLVALTGADNLILLSRAGPAEAVDYSAVSKLFGALSSVGSILFAPLWPEYGAASARGEYEWIRRTFWRSIRLAIAIGIVGGALTLAFSSEIFQLWIGPQVRPSWTLLMFAATWAAIDLCGQCTAMMLNGLAIVRPQMIVALLFALTCLPLKWYLAYVHGAPGAYEATIICYVFAVVVPYSLYIPRLMRKGGH